MAVVKEFQRRCCHDELHAPERGTNNFVLNAMGSALWLPQSAIDQRGGDSCRLARHGFRESLAGTGRFANAKAIDDQPHDLDKSLHNVLQWFTDAGLEKVIQQRFNLPERT